MPELKLILIFYFKMRRYGMLSGSVSHLSHVTPKMYRDCNAIWHEIHIARTGITKGRQKEINTDSVVGSWRLPAQLASWLVVQPCLLLERH